MERGSQGPATSQTRHGRALGPVGLGPGEPNTTQQEITPQWVTYLDVKNDVEPYIQATVAGSTQGVETRLQLFTDMSCQWVQRYLGRPIAPTKFFQRFSGWPGFNGAILALPYYPVIGVQKVVEWWGVSGPHELKEQTPENQIGAEAFQLDPLRGYLIRSFAGLVQRPWFPGSRNIEVTWTAGYNPLPADIKVATLELVAHWWRNTQQASRSAPLPAQYDMEVSAGQMWASVPHRVTDLLSPYVQVGVG